MKQFIKRRPAFAFLVFIVVWTWIFIAAISALVPIDPVEGPTMIHVALVFLVASPSVFGILFARLIDGKDGVRELFRRAGRWRVKPVWYAAALLVVPAVYGLSYLVQGWLGGSLAPIDIMDKLVFAVPIALMACLMEEFGWRGFALPKLLKRHNALTAALIVGVGWALWHAPINYLAVQSFGTGVVPLLMVLAVAPIAETVIMTWIHNNAKASMLLMLLAHFAITSGAIVFMVSSPTAVTELRNNLVLAALFVLTAVVVVVAAGAKRLVRSSWQGGAVALSSPNRMVWALFRSLRRTVSGLSRIDDTTEQKDQVAVAVILAVAAVESFFNLYFRILVETTHKEHRSMVLEDLDPKDGSRPKGLEYKLRHWSCKVLGKSFKWQKGVAHDFDCLRERRNSLMHFTSSYEEVQLPGFRVEGLANTDCYDELQPKHAEEALRLAEGMLEETFRLTGVVKDQIPHDLHGWTGKPPGTSS